MEYGRDYRGVQNQNAYNGSQPSVIGFRQQPLQIETNSRDHMSSGTDEVLAYVLQADGTMAAVRQDDNTALQHNPQILAALRAEQKAQLQGETTGCIRSAAGDNRRLSSGVIEALTTDRNSSSGSTPPFSPSSGIGSTGSAFASSPVSSSSQRLSRTRHYVPRATPTINNQMNRSNSQPQIQTNTFSSYKPSVPPPQYSTSSENRSRFLYPEVVSKGKSGNGAAEMNKNLHGDYKPTVSRQNNSTAAKKYQQSSNRNPPPVPNSNPEVPRHHLLRQSSENQRISPFQMFATNSQKQNADSSKTERWWINKLQNQQNVYGSRRDQELNELNDIRPVRLRTRSRSQPRLRTNRDDGIDSVYQRSEITVEYQPAHGSTPHPPTTPTSTRSRTPRQISGRPLAVETNSTGVHQSSAGLSMKSPSPPTESPKFQRQVSTENIHTSNHRKLQRRNSLKIIKKTSGEQIEVSASGKMQERGRGEIRSDLYSSSRPHRARSVEPKSSRQKVLMDNRLYEQNNFYSDM